MKYESGPSSGRSYVLTVGVNLWLCRDKTSNGVFVPSKGSWRDSTELTNIVKEDVCSVMTLAEDKFGEDIHDASVELRLTREQARDLLSSREYQVYAQAARDGKVGEHGLLEYLYGLLVVVGG